jgi:WD40 repeat protein
MTELASAHDAPGATVDSDNPWPGLEAFREADAAFFFGREHARDELTRLVAQQRLVVLYGRSGLGKTSLLRAGLFPKLRAAQYLPIYVRALFRSTDATAREPDLRMQVKAAIERAAADARVEHPVLDPAATLWEWFSRTDAQFWNERSHRVLPVLVFDQFEEAFTHGFSSDARVATTEQFLSELVDLVRGSVPASVVERLEQSPTEALSFTTSRDTCHILLSMRKEFLPELLRLKPRLPALLDHRFELSGMTVADAERVVTGPGGHLVDPGVADRIVAFVAAARRSSVDQTTDAMVDPAILSVFCRQLNVTRQRRQMSRITAELVSGTQAAIIADFYSQAVADLGPDVRRFIEEDLVTESGFRDSIAVEEARRAPGLTDDIIESLIERRLVRREGAGATARLELTHDVLTDPILESRNVRRIREQAEQARQAEEQARLVAQEAEERELRERQLKFTQELLKKESENAELALELAGQREREAQATARLLDTKWRALRRQRLYVIALVALLALAGSQFYSASRARGRAETNLAAAQLEQGLALVDSRRDWAIAYVTRALEVDPDNLAARSLVLDALLHLNWPLAELNLVHEAPLLWGQFDPEGNRFVTVSEDGTARIWNTKDGSAVGAPLKHGGRALVARFDTTGRLLILADDGHAHLRDFASGRDTEYKHPKVMGDLLNPHRMVWATFRPPDGRVSTIALGGVVSVWNGGATDILDAHEELVTAQFNGTGDQLLTVGRDNAAAIWDLRTKRRKFRLVGHQDAIVAAQWSPDELRVVTGSRDGTARLWDSRTGRLLFPPLRHSKAVTSAQFNPDGTRLVTTSEDGSARLWDTGTGEAVGVPMLHDGVVTSAVFSPEGLRVVTASADGTARLWDAVTGSVLAEPMRHQGPVRSAVFSPNGQHVLTTSADRRARLWDVRTGAAVPSTLRLSCAPETVQFAPSGSELVISCIDGTLVRWDGAARAPSETVVNPLGKPADLNTDGSLMLMVTGDGVNVVRAAGDVVRTLKLPEDASVSSAKFSPDGRTILTARGSSVRMWDAGTGALIATVQNDREIVSADFNGDGSRIITASRDSARVWDPRTGAAVSEPFAQGSTLTDARLSPDARIALTLSADGNARLWDVPTRLRIATLAGDSAVGSAQFSPDGRRVVTGTANGVLRIWDARTGHPHTGLLRHDAPIYAVQFSPDGQRVAGASQDSTVRIWDVPIPRGGDARTLTLLARAVVGYGVNQLGALVPAEDPVDALQKARAAHRSETDSALIGTVRMWVLDDRSTRTISPFSQISVDEYVKLQLESDSADARRETRRQFPWHLRVVSQLRDARMSLYSVAIP